MAIRGLKRLIPGGTGDVAVDPGLPELVVQSDRADRTDGADRADGADRTEGADRTDRPDRVEVMGTSAYLCEDGFAVALVGLIADEPDERVIQEQVDALVRAGLATPGPGALIQLDPEVAGVMRDHDEMAGTSGARFVQLAEGLLGILDRQQHGVQICTVDELTQHAATVWRHYVYALHRGQGREAAGPMGRLITWAVLETQASVGRAEASEAAAQVITDCRVLLGDDDENALAVGGRLSSVHVDAGDLRRAGLTLEWVTEGFRRHLGQDHPETLVAVGNLASVYTRTGRTGEAVEALEAVLEQQRRVLGPDHAATLATTANLTTTLGIMAGPMATGGLFLGESGAPAPGQGVIDPRTESVFLLQRLTGLTDDTTGAEALAAALGDRRPLLLMAAATIEYGRGNFGWYLDGMSRVNLGEWFLDPSDRSEGSRAAAAAVSLALQVAAQDCDPRDLDLLLGVLPYAGPAGIKGNALGLLIPEELNSLPAAIGNLEALSLATWESDVLRMDLLTVRVLLVRDEARGYLGDRLSALADRLHAVARAADFGTSGMPRRTVVSFAQSLWAIQVSALRRGQARSAVEAVGHLVVNLTEEIVRIDGLDAARSYAARTAGEFAEFLGPDHPGTLALNRWLETTAV